MKHTEFYLKELDKLEQWLADNRYNYERRSRLPYNFSGFSDEVRSTLLKNVGERNQLVVFDRKYNKMWDVICQPGSFGYEDGLLEIMGCIVDKGALGGVEGYLTADDVIERVKKYEARKTEEYK